VSLGKHEPVPLGLPGGPGVVFAAMEVVNSGVVTRAIPRVQFLPVEFDGRLVGHLTVEAAGERDEWEMHPEQDEFLYLLEGAIDVLLRGDVESDDEQIIHLSQGEACVVPKGIWHRQVVVEPCKMLFITPETLHRSHVPGEGWTDSAEL
jgi:mannose-6-phosphate isomerase-like protein (cupin superfamily)